MAEQFFGKWTLPTVPIGYAGDVRDDCDLLELSRAAKRVCACADNILSRLRMQPRLAGMLHDNPEADAFRVPALCWR